jgi:putative transposase
MIVGMRTRKQAARVAVATGGANLPGKPKPDGTPTLSRYVDVGPDFETHRPAVESVSVLFELYDGDADVMRRRARRLRSCPPAGW